jgi:DNA-binding transcriptional MerR regulator
MSKTVEIPDQESFKLNEVCKLANVQPYMLRFWGTEFEQLEARKSGTGQRLYTRQQVELILEIRRLLFDEGLTIAGARKKVDAMMEAGGPAAVKEKATRKGAKKAAKSSAEDESSTEEPAPAADDDAAAEATAEPSTAEVVAAAAVVDDVVQQRVEPLANALRDVRGQISELLTELRGS